MASKVILVDDIDGTEGAASYTFAVGGKTYAIDLTEQHYAELLDALEPFTRAGRVERRAPEAVSDTRLIREWAESKGLLDPGSRGRIPYAVREAYKDR